MYGNNFNTFKPKDFLIFSMELDYYRSMFKVNPSTIERDMMGRIYYASFLYVREWAKKHLNYVSNPRRDHTQLPNFLRTHGPFDNATNNQISDNLKILKRLRQQSDYYIKLPPKGSVDFDKWIFENTSFAFKLADNIISSFENFNFD